MISLSRPARSLACRLAAPQSVLHTSSASAPRAAARSHTTSSSISLSTLSQQHPQCLWCMQPVGHACFEGLPAQLFSRAQLFTQVGFSHLRVSRRGRTARGGFFCAFGAGVCECALLRPAKGRRRRGAGCRPRLRSQFLMRKVAKRKTLCRVRGFVNFGFVLRETWNSFVSWAAEEPFSLQNLSKNARCSF